MEDNNKEKYINTSPSPVSLKGTKKILDQMNNCVCRIYNNQIGTGFFTKIPYKSKLLPKDSELVKMVKNSLWPLNY